MSADVIQAAIAEARRRTAASDRDLQPAVAHFARQLQPVCRAWRLVPDHWFDGGAGMPTLAVTGPDGIPGVLKLAKPGELDAAARVMSAADGRGYARVLAWDADRGAMLIERLGPMLWTQAPTLAEQVTVVAPLLQAAWRVPREAGSPFIGKAAGLLAILTDFGPRYGSDLGAAMARATAYARELADTERPEVVCHGDPHAGNVLRRGDGWTLIDPDGFVGERAYDLGVVLRDACREIAAAQESQPGSGEALLREECRRLAGWCDVDAERVWRWAFVERVTTALYLRWHGYLDQAESFAATATLLARAAE
ncbi:MAG TPA: aminoglycoside phosphotransferase family protein [Dermatophilaceae bacterium]|nr:phosphotransferase [Actinomycetales bacterium]HMT90956.1 aminoglycoside phosphotransferase family protein [Dermatophilaceae bacterium]